MQTKIVIQKQNDSDTECPICLDTFDKGIALFTAECGHEFHYECLMENINHDQANSDKCPICRREQKVWPTQTMGLADAHPHCTNCGVKSNVGDNNCSHCGNSVVHTPTRIRRNNRAHAGYPGSQATTLRDSNASAERRMVVECPTCRIRCMVTSNMQGPLLCPSGHRFMVNFSNQLSINLGTRVANPHPNRNSTTAITRVCPTCQTRVQMPPNSRRGEYMCPRSHRFWYIP